MGYLYLFFTFAVVCSAAQTTKVNLRWNNLGTLGQSTTHTHPFNGPLSGTTQVNRYQKGKTNLDFTEARDSEWQCHQLGHMQVCASLQTDNHASTPQAGCPSCRPTNSVKALKALGQSTTNRKLRNFLSEVGRRLSSLSGDSCETSFLFQHLSMNVQRFNSALITDSFCFSDEDPDL